MKNISENPVGVFLLSIFFLSCYLNSCHAVNTITKGVPIKDGDIYITRKEIFQLGFFSIGNSSLRYVGIRYHKIEVKAVVWIANRDRPISNENGTFLIADDGNLRVLDGNNNPVWSSNASIESNDTTAVLLEDGNLVLSSTGEAGNLEKAYWQSFDHPTDTYLPGMRLRVIPTIGETRVFTSWKSPTDPSSGNFTMGIDPHGAPQIVMWQQQKRRWRSGQWNDQIFTGVPSMATLTNFLYGFKLSTREPDGSTYFTYVQMNASDLLRFHLSWNGFEEQLRWDAVNKNWTVMQGQPQNDCELYNFCGNFGVCMAEKSPKCSCMQGFVPKNQEEWNGGNWSGGCVRRTQLQCQRNGNNGGDDGFKGFKCMKLPDFAVIASVGSSETCRDKCLQNCSCNAYAEVNGIGCMIWNGDLIDVQEFDRLGSLLQLRLAASELGGKRISKTVIIVIVIVGSLVLGVSLWLLWMFRGKLKGHMRKVSSLSCCNSKTYDLEPTMDMGKSGEFSADLSGPADILVDGSQGNGADLPMFSFSYIAAATNNFSGENKLGQGGFGPVYRGKLPGEQEIAVKRLSRKSGQGLEEFKNELTLIAKLQHRNLVRLLGCCIQGEDMMLIYEYMPNKSLDFFLFDPSKRAQLDWTKRFSIIEGIARGLLYLHRDSRLRIIHRDLKASNILLDEDMNPKISDFGMARMFGGNQDEANTMRVVGTYGYMAPEYAMEGLFSVKSDVYSFGVLLLEILSGRRNSSFRSTDYSNLIGYAWSLWNEGRAIELVDPNIRNSSSQNQALKCIHLGMLCVQDSAMHRPDMAKVVLMLESDTPTLPVPRQPTLTSNRNSDIDLSLEAPDTVSSNDLTVTMVSGR